MGQIATRAFFIAKALPKRTRARYNCPHIMRTRSAVFVSLLSSLLLLAGCPGPDPMVDGGDAGPGTDAPGTDAPGADVPPPRDAPIPDTVPIFRNPVSTPDAELAQMALRIMGSTDAGATRVLCNDCHDLTRQQINFWRALSDNALTTCLTDLTLAGGDAAAAEVVSCIRGGDGRYATNRLGIFATGGDLDWFRYTFAHGGDATAHETFLTEAYMPRGYPSLTQAEFDILAEWFIRGVPGLEDIVPADPLPTVCTPNVSADMTSYLEDRATNGWSAINRTNGMLMYGCAGAATPADCLATETLASATTFGADWDDVGTAGIAGARNRVLFTTNYSSAYWTRSSSDGRFVSHGASSAPNLRFVDLAGGGTGALSGRVIGGSASYDPFFFPDDSGFVVQGSGPRVCEMSVLTTGSPTMLSFTEAGCTSGRGIGLYEHLGAALGGGDYWAIDSTTTPGGTLYATYDNGGQGPTLSNPEATFSTGARSTVRFLANTGTGFNVVASANIDHPFEGDAVISPSTGLMVTRQAGASGQLGFVVRRLVASGTGTTRTLTGLEVGRYCGIEGGKPGFSYDERWIVFHHYVESADAVALGFSGPADPAFAPYRTRGAANLYLFDLATGTSYRITNMGPGQYALFPHFRSDGWIYYIVRTEGTTPEHIVASDAALLAPPL